MPRISDEEREKLLELVRLLIEPAYTGDYSRLTDEQLDQVIANQRSIEGIGHSLDMYAVPSCEMIKERRRKIAEFRQLPTDELMRLYSRFRSDHIAAVRGDWNDSAGDSLYSPPSGDSDEAVVTAILEERGLRDSAERAFHQAPISVR